MRMKKKKSSLSSFVYTELLFELLSAFERVQVEEERNEKKNTRRRDFHALRAQSGV